MDSIEAICPVCHDMTPTEDTGKPWEWLCLLCGNTFNIKPIEEEPVKKTLERKTLRFEVKAVDEETGVFEGYASTFAGAPDSYGDVVDKGAFTKTITDGRRRIKILWNHDVSEPIGKPILLTEDEHGLFVKGKLSLGVQRAREVLSLMKDGVINEMSIGYDTIIEEVVGKVRHLKEVRLWDVSPVTYAANPEAVVTDVKNDKSGRVLSAANVDKIQSALDALQSLLDLAQTEEPEKSTPPVDKEAEAVGKALADFQSIAQGFDAKQAEKRIEAMVTKLKEINYV